MKQDPKVECANVYDERKPELVDATWYWVPRGTMVTHMGKIRIFIAGALVIVIAAFMAFLDLSDDPALGTAVLSLVIVLLTVGLLRPFSQTGRLSIRVAGVTLIIVGIVGWTIGLPFLVAAVLVLYASDRGVQRKLQSS